MDITEEFIHENSYDNRITELVNDYLINRIDSLEFDQFDEETQKELAGLYFLADKQHTIIAEETLIDVLRDEVGSWGILFMWGGLTSLGYGQKYINKMHSEMFGSYMRGMKRFIQNDIDECYSRMSSYTHKDIDEMFL